MRTTPRKLRNSAIAAAAAGALAGCAGAVPGNDQGMAGITDVRLEWCPVGEIASDWRLCNIVWRDGKEKQSVRLAADIGRGTIDYSATTVAAFDGQRVRGEVEKAVAQALGATVGEGGTARIVDAVMMGLRGALGAP